MKGEIMKGRPKRVNIPGEIKVIDEGNGIIELQKTPDVLCMTPRRESRLSAYAMPIAVGGIIIGLAVAVMVMAPAFATIFFGLIAAVMFGGWAMGE